MNIYIFNINCISCYIIYYNNKIIIDGLILCARKCQQVLCIDISLNHISVLNFDCFIPFNNIRAVNASLNQIQRYAIIFNGYLDKFCGVHQHISLFIFRKACLTAEIYLNTTILIKTFISYSVCF